MLPDENRATQLDRGYMPRIYEHADMELVEHWCDHVRMETSVDVQFNIEKITTETVEA